VNWIKGVPVADTRVPSVEQLVLREEKFADRNGFLRAFLCREMPCRTQSGNGTEVAKDQEIS
jgi:hypothetical protein